MPFCFIIDAYHMRLIGVCGTSKNTAESISKMTNKEKKGSRKRQKSFSLKEKTCFKWLLCSEIIYTGWKKYIGRPDKIQDAMLYRSIWNKAQKLENYIWDQNSVWRSSEVSWVSTFKQHWNWTCLSTAIKLQWWKLLRSL